MKKQKSKKYTVNQLREKAEKKAVQKESVYDTPRIRNAPEYQFDQVWVSRQYGNSKTEEEALNNIEELHITPANNVKHKKAAIFQFKRVRKNSTQYYYECDLPDHYVFRVEKMGEKSYKAYYAYSPVDSTYPGRADLKGFGTSWTDAIAHLMGIPQFKNPHSARWLNFFELCDPHIRMGTNQDMTLPSNPGKIPTQERVNAINSHIPRDAGSKEQERKVIDTESLHKRKFTSFEELRVFLTNAALAQEKKEEKAKKESFKFPGKTSKLTAFEELAVLLKDNPSNLI